MPSACRTTCSRRWAKRPERGDEHGYTLPRHVERAGIPHVLLEIRQDLIDTRRGAEEWAEKLYTALGPLLADPALRSLQAYS